MHVSVVTNLLVNTISPGKVSVEG